MGEALIPFYVRLDTHNATWCPVVGPALRLEEVVEKELDVVAWWERWVDDAQRVRMHSETSHFIHEAGTIP